MRLTERRLKNIVKDELQKLTERRLTIRNLEGEFLQDLRDMGMEVEDNSYAHRPSRVIGDTFIYNLVGSEEEGGTYTLDFSVQDKDDGFRRTSEKPEDKFNISGSTSDNLASKFKGKLLQYES